MSIVTKRAHASSRNSHNRAILLISLVSPLADTKWKNAKTVRYGRVRLLSLFDDNKIRYPVTDFSSSREVLQRRREKTKREIK